MFNAYTGAANSYISANYTAAGDDSTGGGGNTSAWLFAPTRTWSNGDTVSFATRTASDSLFADHLEVRFSKSGSSTFAGWNDQSVGNFNTLLLDINPSLQTSGYPSEWTVYSATISGLSAPTSGRIGFRYEVPNAGVTGLNGNIVGLDNYKVSATPTKEQVSERGGSHHPQQFRFGRLLVRDSNPLCGFGTCQPAKV